MTDLFSHVLRSLKDNPHGWTSPEMGCSLAAGILMTRPMYSVEIGVFGGKGLVSMALAHKEIGNGKAIGIDPWKAQDSVESQAHPNDVKWWGELDHEAIYQSCLSQIRKNAVEPFTHIMRMKSSEVPVPRDIGVLRIDGNHGEPAYVDTFRFSQGVIPGGYLFLDDVDWTGGAVRRAADWLRANGWKQLYPLDDAIVFQKIGK